MTRSDPLRVLLVEDDEDDFVLTQTMLMANGRTKFDLDWEQSYAAALDVVRVTSHDLYLVDYRLGDHTGLDLVRNAWGTDPPAPVILLTGQDDYAVDMEATALGVTDYLVKGTIDAPSLERTIRYAVRQHQTMIDLRRSEERYAVAVRATNDGIWDWDLIAERVHFSERWKMLLGYEDLDADQMATWFDARAPRRSRAAAPRDRLAASPARARTSRTSTGSAAATAAGAGSCAAACPPATRSARRSASPARCRTSPSGAMPRSVSSTMRCTTASPACPTARC